MERPNNRNKHLESMPKESEMLRMSLLREMRMEASNLFTHMVPLSMLDIQLSQFFQVVQSVFQQTDQLEHFTRAKMEESYLYLDP